MRLDVVASLHTHNNQSSFSRVCEHDHEFIIRVQTRTYTNMPLLNQRNNGNMLIDH